jgi:branched-chain amino acid transport system substrate-binding protein
MRCVAPALSLGMALVAAPADADVRIGLAAPLTGPYAWGGAWTRGSAEVAVADLNAAGGVLDETVAMIVADDYCNGEQAIAVANKLIADGVVAVFGHQCSGAAIPASEVYAEAGILMISTGATNPKLTERGLSSVFRTIGRDDVQGAMAAELLAEHWGDKSIAILHDGQAYGKGLAGETKKRLNERGITASLFEAVEPGRPEYLDLVRRMQSAGIDVLYYGGYMAEAGLIVRHAADLGYELQLVGGDGISPKDFGLIAGAASDGTLMTYVPPPPETCSAGSASTPRATSAATIPLSGIAGRAATTPRSTRSS